MSTSTAEHDSYLVENWDTETLIAFLKEQNLKLDDKKHYDILRKQEVTGLSFLKLTEEKLIAPPYNFPGGPALLLAEEIKALKEKPKRSFSSYKTQKDLKEVLSKYGVEDGRITDIPQFV